MFGSQSRLLPCTWALSFLHIAMLVNAEIMWTPILPTQPDQIDLWTVSSTGCPCESASADIGYKTISRVDKSRGCACCVPRIACPCGNANPHRCAQCGLQHHCNKMCNVTIDGALLSVSAGTLGGSLTAPPDVEAPLHCWYNLRAPPGHRVEVQLHRLIQVGSSHNGTACRGGYVEISDSDNRVSMNSLEFHEEREGNSLSSNPEMPGRESHRKSAGHTSIQICGEDQRLHPPAVVFSDTGIATIIYKVSATQGRPRFMFYYNFPPATDPTTGNMQWGGTRVQYTVCDWLYQDVHCSEQRPCHLTSPGHPGLYPPDTRCKYLFAMRGSSVRGFLHFKTMDLPADRCASSFIALYSGTSTSSALITTLCGNDQRTLTISGPSVLLEFNTGPFLPPYKYSGFHATIHFQNSTESSSTTQNTPLTETTEKKHDGILRDPNGLKIGDQTECKKVFWGNWSSSGRFDTSTYVIELLNDLLEGKNEMEESRNEKTHRRIQKKSNKSRNKRRRSRNVTLVDGVRKYSSGRKSENLSPRHCLLRFIGSQDEVIQISLFKYQLSGSKCISEAAVYDGIAQMNGDNLLRHICGPVTREPKDANDNFLQPELYTSSSNILELYIKFGEKTDPKRQFLAGAYQFHNSRISGTKKPNSACDVMFYGASSAPKGVISQPGASLLWNMEGPLSCSYLMVPAVNQSLTLTLKSMTGVRGSGHCMTHCGPEGCVCEPVQLPLSQVDHMLFTDTERERVIGCLCGDLHSQRSISLRSTSGINIKYHLGHYSWFRPGFNFTLTYAFPRPLVCGPLFHNTPAGLLVPASETRVPMSTFLYTSCPWVIEIPEGVTLTVVVQPPTNGSCGSWNLTGLAYTRIGGWEEMGNVCGGGKRRQLSYKAGHSAAAITLQQSGRPFRDWLITWRSQRSGIIITDIAHATPKPELSRVLHSHPSRTTLVVETSDCNRLNASNILLILLSLLFIIHSSAFSSSASEKRSHKKVRISSEYSYHIDIPIDRTHSLRRNEEVATLQENVPQTNHSRRRNFFVEKPSATDYSTSHQDHSVKTMLYFFSRENSDKFYLLHASVLSQYVTQRTKAFERTPDPSSQVCQVFESCTNIKKLKNCRYFLELIIERRAADALQSLEDHRKFTDIAFCRMVDWISEIGSFKVFHHSCDCNCLYFLNSFLHSFFVHYIKSLVVIQNCDVDGYLGILDLFSFKRSLLNGIE